MSTPEDEKPIVVDSPRDVSIWVLDPGNKQTGELTFEEMGIGEGFVASIRIGDEEILQLSHVPEEERDE